MRTLIYSLAFFAVSLLVSCSGSGAEETKQEDILGKWLLTTAQRNGELTTTLGDNVYFEFTPENKVISNFPAPNFPSDEAVNYKIENNQLTFTDVDFTFDIKSLSEKEMILTTEILNYRFELLFEPANEE